MYRMATVTAYDVLESVQVSCRVLLWDGSQIGSPTSEFTTSVLVQGVGSATDHEWLRDALVALLETL